MFCTGCHRCGGSEIGTLKSAHHCRTESGGQIRVFAKAFGNTSPARIACNVEHRGKGPADTLGSGFECRYLCSFFNNRGVESGSLTQWYGEDGVIAVNHITGKHDGHTASLHGSPLQTVDVGERRCVENRPHFAACCHGKQRIVHCIAVELVHLAYFLLKAHGGQDGVYLLLYVGRGVCLDVYDRSCTGK